MISYAYFSIDILLHISVMYIKCSLNIYSVITITGGNTSAVELSDPEEIPGSPCSFLYC